MLSPEQITATAIEIIGFAGISGTLGFTIGRATARLKSEAEIISEHWRKLAKDRPRRKGKFVKQSYTIVPGVNKEYEQPAFEPLPVHEPTDRYSILNLGNAINEREK